jgi:hypothetical protein
MWELGPVECRDYPLLTDAQIVSLLCAGSPDARPSLDNAVRVLEGLRLDYANSEARARAILCAGMFHEWRESVYFLTGAGARTSLGAACRLAHTRASMARLVAGLNVAFVRSGPPGGRVDYPADALPAGGFQARDGPPEAYRLPAIAVAAPPPPTPGPPAPAPPPAVEAAPDALPEPEVRPTRGRGRPRRSNA